MYLKKRFGTQELIVQWAYSIVDACRKLKDRDTACFLFLDILESMNNPIHFPPNTKVKSC
jgi:hypothetical protein